MDIDIGKNWTKYEFIYLWMWEMTWFLNLKSLRTRVGNYEKKVINHPTLTLII
jgi:hypothetical protein